MRITFLCPPPNLTGGIRVVAIYAEKLALRGHQVLVVYPEPGDLPLNEKIGKLFKEGRWPSPRPVGPSHLDGRTIERRQTPRGRAIVDTDVPDADVVVATWWETAEWAARLSPNKGRKVYFVQHHELFAWMPVERVKATYRLPFYKITIARWLVDVLRDDYGDAEAVLVPNSVDLDQFHAPSRGKQPVPTVGFMYSNAEFKGSDIIVRALELARNEVPQLEVVAFGEARPSEPLMLGPRVRFVHRPPQETIRSLYAAADAWIVGSRSEGFGLPLLEAMACRTPVIATPTGAAPQLIEQGGGLLVRHEDPSDMSAAIVKLARMSEGDWLALSARAHAIASSYTWDDAATLFEQALRDSLRHSTLGA